MNDKKSFWSTVPGILTGIAALISSTGGFIVILKSICWPPFICVEQHTVPPIETIIVEVCGTSNGNFGFPKLGGDSLVKTPIPIDPAMTLSIKAEGTISISNEGPHVDPDGENMPFQERYSQELATPLQQHLATSGKIPLPRPDPIPQVGALFGVLVPLYMANDENFNAVDEATVKQGGMGIDAATLFFIGSEKVIKSSQEHSVLFLGVNDPGASNNSGCFNVVIKVLP